MIMKLKKRPGSMEAVEPVQKKNINALSHEHGKTMMY
jgi:hypothetical protein